MSSKVEVRSGSSIGFMGALCLVFIVLKLCGVIAWSWWWVLAPMWAPLVLVVAAGLLALCGAVIILGVMWLVQWVKQHRGGQ